MQAVLTLLRSHGAALVLGPTGVGKSGLALDVGQRLWQAGEASAGLLWVDLAGVRGAAGVDRQFCTALGVPMVR